MGGVELAVLVVVSEDPPAVVVVVVVVAVPEPGEAHQVWSLTLFHSVDFLQSRPGVKQCVSNKRTRPRFASAVFDSCFVVFWDHCAKHGTPMTVSMYLCSSRSNARGESRAREGHRVSSKSPSRV